jgi:hypothetical protein
LAPGLDMERKEKFLLRQRIETHCLANYQ